MRSKQVHENRQYVMYVMEALLYCGQQGIAICGHRETEKVGSFISVGNYLNLLKLQSRHTDFLRKRLGSGPKNASLLGHYYQISMLQVLAESVLGYIKDEVRAARYYSIVTDKTKHISNKEQMTSVICYALKGVVHERFISYTHCEELNAAALQNISTRFSLLREIIPNYAAAASCIEATEKTLANLKCKDQWDKIWDEAAVFAQAHKPILTHYGNDEECISSELLTAPTVLCKVSSLTCINQVYSHLNEVNECFPLLLEALQIAMTIGVTTATAERTFSSLRRLKTFLRSTILQKRLNHLSLLRIKKDLSAKLWDNLGDVVLKFSPEHKNSRMVLQ
uniref:HAT C-terminal dimerisation domain-containing protein n=1 Tax=Amphimedon queenslandica TaxID=400682 RepID=A0A1X7V0B1_AMPQE